MTDAQKVVVLKEKLEKIREATFAEFQDLPPPPQKKNFQLDRHICPYCLRASTADHLHDAWAMIQSLTAEGLRAIEE